MSATPPARSFTLLAVAIVVAAILVSATLFVALGTPSTVTRTVPGITTTTFTRTVTGALTGEAPLLYEVEFIQQSACPGGIWLAPWSVTLNNQTIVRPSGATLPLSEGGFQAGGTFQNDSVISFSVPNGTYSYSIDPKAFLGQAGNLTVDGDDIIVQVHPAPVLCTTSTG